MRVSFAFTPSIWIALLAVTAAGATGCGPRTFNDADALHAYVYSDEYPSKKVVSREGVTVVARYLPTSVLMINDYRAAEREVADIRSDASLSDAQRSQRIGSLARSLRDWATAYEASVYFSVSLGLQSGEDIVYAKLKREGFSSYSTWLETLLFDVEDYISLREGPLALDPSGYHLDRTYGMAPIRSFVVSFPRTQLNQGRVELQMAEFGLGTGTLTFSFDVRQEVVTYTLSS